MQMRLRFPQWCGFQGTVQSLWVFWALSSHGRFFKNYPISAGFWLFLGFLASKHSAYRKIAHRTGFVVTHETSIEQCCSRTLYLYLWVQEIFSPGHPRSLQAGGGGVICIARTLISSLVCQAITLIPLLIKWVLRHLDQCLVGACQVIQYSQEQETSGYCVPGKIFSIQGGIYVLKQRLSSRKIPVVGKSAGQVSNDYCSSDGFCSAGACLAVCPPPPEYCMVRSFTCDKLRPKLRL